MSKQPEELAGFGAVIVAAFSMCDIRIPGLFTYYLEERFKEGLGRPKHGEGENAFRAWMMGKSEPGATEFIFVCRAINRRLAEIGKEPMLPDLPFPRVTLGGGDGTEMNHTFGPSQAASEERPFLTESEAA